MKKKPTFGGGQARELLERRAPSPSPAAPAAGTTSTHPAAVQTGSRTDADHLWLDPSRIELEGDYVREPVDEERDEIAALGDSMRQGGNRQAIGVRQLGEGIGQKRWILIYGRRRLEAARQAGLAQVLVRNYGALAAAEAYRLQIEENEKRKNVHPVDQALSYHLAIEKHGLQQVDIIRSSSENKSNVSRLARVGAAIAALTPDERRALRQAPIPHRTVFSTLAKEALPDRLARLRQIIGGAPRARQEGSASRLRVQPLPDGAGLTLRGTIRWHEVEADPALQQVLQTLVAEVQSRLRGVGGE